MATVQLDPGTPEPALEIRDRRMTRNVADRAGLVVLLAATGVFYLWNITVNGMANTFYAAAAWAGSRNWEALLFGSLDPVNFITVDKPPVSQWVMGLSGKVFGFSSASMLVPEALMAVAAVALLYGAVARISGPRCGLLAGALLALTPVAALMFRYNNPDAVMVLLMTAAAYCTVRAVQTAAMKWVAWAGVALGFAFLAKMGEGLLVMPALALTYLVAAPTALRWRLLHLVCGLATFVVSAGWFVLLTVLWPDPSRPYIAGSTDNSFINLALGKNGVSHLLGAHHPAAHQPPAHGGASPLSAQSSHGLARLFSGEIAVEVGWLVPAAIMATGFVMLARRRAARTDIARAAAILFGGWIIVDGLVLSFMPGNIHPYYCLSIAPAVTGAIAVGVGELCSARESRAGRACLAVLVLGTGVWSWWLLGWNPPWIPLLRWTILALTAAGAVALVVAATSRPRVAAAGALAALVGALAGPAAYSVATIGQPHGGGRPAVGPASAAQRSGGGHANFEAGPDNPRLDAMLSAARTPWSAATDYSSNAASLELATRTAVMAIGGFSGGDPVPTLSQFIDDVHNRKVSYFVVEHNDETNEPGSGHHIDISRWVAVNFRPVTVGPATVYDLAPSAPQP